MLKSLGWWYLWSDTRIKSVINILSRLLTSLLEEKGGKGVRSELNARETRMGGCKTLEDKKSVLITWETLDRGRSSKDLRVYTVSAREKRIHHIHQSSTTRLDKLLVGRTPYLLRLRSRSMIGPRRSRSGDPIRPSSLGIGSFTSHDTDPAGSLQ